MYYNILSMNKSIFIVILLLFFSCDKKPPLHGDYDEGNLDDNGRQMIWNDEFSGAAGSLPDPIKWSFFDGWGNVPYRDAIYTTDDAYMDGQGHLVIRARKEVTNSVTNYKTSSLWTRVTKNDFKYGYFKCRFKCSELQAKGLWVAFWLFAEGSAPYDGNMNTGTEIDIFEYAYMNNWMQGAVHWGSSASMPYETSNIRDGGFHTVALEWKENELIFYYDGIQFWRYTDNVSKGNQYIMLTLEIEDVWGAGSISDPGNSALLPDYWYVDYVRVYQ